MVPMKACDHRSPRGGVRPAVRRRRSGSPTGRDPAQAQESETGSL